MPLRRQGAYDINSTTSGQNRITIPYAPHASQHAHVYAKSHCLVIVPQPAPGGNLRASCEGDEEGLTGHTTHVTIKLGGFL
jgi:hypothetical protein